MLAALRVAIVGSGPAGFYTAEALLRAGADCSIDMLERLPTPHGLVRYGVAPDHQKLKQVAAVFDAIASDARMRFFGGVEVGVQVSLEELRERYHAVVLATGAPAGRALNVPGEDLPQVHGSARFVGWYNGHPDAAHLRPDLGGAAAVVVGNGNVALDVCRLLLRPYEELQGTDIPEPVLPVFRRRGVRQVHIVGRGGVAATKFSFKEFRQLVEQPGLQVAVPQAPACFDAGIAAAPSDDAARVARWLREHAAAGAGTGTGAPCVSLWFHAAAAAFLGEASLTGVALAPVRAGCVLPPSLACDLAVTCIGYEQPRSSALAALAPAPQAHRAGQLVDARGEELPGLLVAGWAKRGPTGIIGTNRACGYETAATLLARGASLTARTLNPQPLEALIAARATHATTSYRDWLRIDGWERARGAALGKPREKATSRADITNVLAAADESWQTSCSSVIHAA